MHPVVVWLSLVLRASCPQLARLCSAKNRDAFWVADNIDDQELREIVVNGHLYFHSVMGSVEGLSSLLQALASNGLESLLGADSRRMRIIIACGPEEVAAARNIQRLVRGHLARKLVRKSTAASLVGGQQDATVTQ